MHHRDGHIVNYVNATQFAAQMSAFGETAPARPIVSELTWLSLTRGFGGLGVFYKTNKQ